MSDEQRVRTMAGWIGVEISRSRVRTPRKAGYGLYRVRGSKARDPLDFGECRELSGNEMPDIRLYVPTGWTAYAFVLSEIGRAVKEAIATGTPAGPAALSLPLPHPPAIGALGAVLPEPPRIVTVPTRWTQAYRGRRDLGVAMPVPIKREFAEEVSALAALVGEGLVAMEHVPGVCGCEGTWRLTAACVQATTERENVRTRQRAQNDEFQREHLERRRWGKERRHADRLRNDTPRTEGSVGQV